MVYFIKFSVFTRLTAFQPYFILMFGRINIFKKKNIPIPLKIIVLAAIGFVFLFFLFFSIWNQYFADNLAKYAPSKTVAYVHFSLPNTKNSPEFNSFFRQILAENNLKGFNPQWLKRELALVFWLKKDFLNQDVLLKVENPIKAKEYFLKNNLNYNFLDGNTAVISKNPDFFVKNSKNNLIQKIKGKFSFLNTVSVFVSQNTGEYLVKNRDLSSFINVFLKDSSGIFLNIQLKRNGLKISQAGNSGFLEELKISAPILNSKVENYHFVGRFQNFFGMFLLWKEKFSESSRDFDYFFDFFRKKYGLPLKESVFNEFLGSESIVFLNKKKNGQEKWFLERYDFCLKIKKNFQKEQITELKNFFKLIFAFKFPDTKIFHLSDQTKVVELIPNLEKFQFIEKNGFQVIVSPDKKSWLGWKNKNGWLTITNNFDLTIEQKIQFQNNYLKTKTDFLPEGKFWNYLKNFETLEVNNNLIVLR